MSAPIGFEFALVLILVIANGIFSMSELAVMSARKARLHHRASQGSSGARLALDLANEPEDFLSTVQIGITLIGTLAGAFGGATLAGKLSLYLVAVPAIAPYAETISITVVVLVISYLSLILGELVPKRIALNNPERIASAVAAPMRAISRIAMPAVRFLSWSTRVVMKVLPFRPVSDQAVTEDEIKVLIQQGTEAGAFEPAEQAMVSGVFRLADRRVVELMTARRDVMWIDTNEDAEQVRRKIDSSIYSRYPVGRGSLDQVIGMIGVKDLFSLGTTDPKVFCAALKQPLFVPEMMTALSVLERFQQTGNHVALVVNEHGGVQGMIALHDILEAITGEMQPATETEADGIAESSEGVWLVDGLLPIRDLKELLRLEALPGEEDAHFTTVGGFTMGMLERIPAEGDHFDFLDYHLEVVKMDGKRVDKVRINHAPAPAAMTDDDDDLP
jgi:putative hemolysin